MEDAVFEWYLVDKAAQGRSEFTLQKARWAWKKLKESYGQTPLLELNARDITDWHALLFRHGLSQNTVSTHGRAIHNFLVWARDKQLVAFEPPKAPPPAKPDRLTLSPDQVAKFIRAMERGRNRLRNRAIAMLLLATGLRLGEMHGLRVADLDLREGMCYVRGQTSKSKKGRITPLGDLAKKALYEYIQFGRGGASYPVLFLAEGGGPLGRRGIELVVSRAARRAGLRSVSPHILRHTFATQALLNGASAFHVKSLLGHASIRSTEIYMDMAAIQKSLTTQRWTPLDMMMHDVP